MTRTTRRDMMGAGLFTALAGVAAVSVAMPDKLRHQYGDADAKLHPDAALVALCDEIADLERQWAASVEVSSDMDSRDPRHGAFDAHERGLVAQQGPLIDRLNEMPTHTLDGFRARARLIALSDYGHVEDGNEHHGMLWALVSALAGEDAYS